MSGVKVEDGTQGLDSASALVSAHTSRPPKSSFKLKNWDEHLLRFLEAAGLDQSAKGFGLDMMVLNQNSEKRVLAALEQLCSVALGKSSSVNEVDDTSADESLDEMKRRHLPANVPTPSQNVKNISRFLADVRSRVDQSNRDEFVRRKRPRPADPSAPVPPHEVPSAATGSARTDAIKLNRDVQMKYDIVKNEDGPLGKTMKSKDVHALNHAAATLSTSRAAFNDRFETIESHLALKYVPAPPADFMLRVKHIEDYIIRLEKEYPPWAALHFNQPHRGWPPPPRESLIVIPPHLTSSTRLDVPQSHSERPMHSRSENAPNSYSLVMEDESAARAKGKARAGRQESSLLRAALDKLEVQKALGGKF
ncbi:hypothetical protein BDV93DRAFT_604361 [Ceratobasidium sp. AG-I]|nr:hypothetical protein BDV93DRAFT_604361 [Ceratobasidium sp. AG-I]